MFTRDDVADLVGPGAYARGEDYADRGMVMTVARNSAGTTIVGQVRGSGTAQYVTVVQLSGPGPQAVPRSSRCSCPVGASCKHAAATLLTYLQRREPRPASALAVPGAPPEASSSTSPGMLPGPAWEQAFAQLLDPSRSVPPRDRPGVVRRGADQVGLQFELQPPRPQVSVRRRGGREPAGTEPRLGMRPVLRGASGRWVRTGISWRDLGHYGFVARTLPEAQLEALRSLYGLATASLDRAYYDPPALIFADEMPGSALFSVLEDAIGAGVPLLRSDRRQSPVTLAAPAQTVLRLASVPHGLVVTAAVLSGGERCDPERTVLLGHPASGMFRWLGTASAQAVGKETDVVLGRLATPADDIVRGLLTQSAPLLVPAADADRFLVRVLPELRRRVDDVLVDAAIELPEPPQPTLCLEVTRLPDHRARLAWSWRYRTRVGQVPEAAESVLTATLGDSPAGTIRDVVVEQRILARVAARVPRLRSVLDRVGAGAHAGTGAEELRGMDTARFFTAVLPELTACAEQDPDLVVVVLDEAAGQVDYRFSDEVEVRVSTSPRAGSRDWFDLEVFVRAGEQEVPFAEVFRALAAGEGHLLLRDGLHFSLADERFARLRDLIDEARALQDTMGGGLRVHRVQAAYFAELEALGVIGEQADSWRAALGALVHGGPEAQLDPPAGLRAAMRPYQQAGYEWLAFRHRHGLGGVLADDMGLGKTVQALALVQHAHERVAGAAAGTGAGAATAATAPPGARLPFLVVAPTSVVGNWVAEARQFTPDLGVVAVHETRARRRSSLAETVAGADVVVTSYALFRLDFEEYAGVAWGGLILDEAQFVKNYRSVTYQCVRRLDVPVRFALTGTPLENDLMELWSILSIVAPGLFPHPGRFAEYYARPIEREGNADQLARLRRRIAPFLLRRTKEQVAADLPAKQEQVTQVVLNPRHRKAYDRYLQRERAKVLGIVDELDDHRFEVFRSLTVLRQAALDVSLVDEENASVPSSKLDELFEMLEDILAEGHSVLVFSQFTRFLRRVRDHLDGEGVAYSYLDGRTRRRTETIERFASGQTSVFLISLKAGGFGLNLTAADYCILLDPWWNPAAEAQAVDRAHRIGQTRTVMVYRMVSTDTIEDKVMTLKAAKSSLFGSVFDEAGSSEAGSSEAGSGGAAMGAGGALTAADVRELLA